MIADLLQGLRELVYPPTSIDRFDPRTIDFSQRYVSIGEFLIEFNRPSFCVKCSRHLGPQPGHNICPTCRRFNPAFDFAWSACLYSESLLPLLHQFKFHQLTRFRRIFGQIMVAFLNHYRLDIRQFDLIVPVPLSSTRSRERGFNQSLLLSRPIAQQFEIPIDTNILKRRHTVAQHRLHRKERWTNLKGTFTIKNFNAIKGKNILIIDDLLTTGATASEIATTLKAAKAKTVGVLTLATTPGNDIK